jgi:UDP-GlcNAc:undecaprenyl-phosphate GlcNAc-1-phosphate transferase
MTNLINLIDGVDGLAGGICLMLMSLLVFMGGGAGPTSFIAAGMAGALLGFLRFNFPPARIYMGDGGAYFLGFLIGCISITSSQKGTIFAALSAPLFVLALPILDTLLAILRRGLRRRKLVRSDTKHKTVSAPEKGKDFTNRVLAWW